MTEPAFTSVTIQPQPKTRLPAIDHALKVRAIQNDRAMRAASNTKATAELLFFGLDRETLTELRELQQSAWRRLATLQKGWVAEWFGWFGDADRIKSANTLSKLVEMEANILARATQLLGTQITSLVALQENIEVDYGYLIQQILAARKSG